MNIDLKLFRAVALARGISDVRYYRNGVFLQAAPGSRTLFIVATDGYRLHYARQELSDVLPDGLSAILNEASVKALLALKDDIVEMSPDATMAKAASALIPLEKEAGTYPDWRRVIPRNPGPPIEQFAVNPAFLTVLHEAAKLIAGSKAAAVLRPGSHDDQLVAVVPGRPEFGAVVMGQRQLRNGPSIYQPLPPLE